MRALRLVVRVGVLLCLAAAAVSLAALAGEYPGDTAAGRRVAAREVLPLALLPWAHLAALDLPPGGRAASLCATAAALCDVALLVQRAGGIRAGAPPLSLALPLIAALLLGGTIGVSWLARRRTH